MGLFDKVFGGKDKTAPPQQFTKEESFLAIALATSAADGHISQSEVDGIINYLARMRMFETFNGQQMNRMFERLIGIIRREGPSALVQSAKSTLPNDLRETAFACAVDIALTDGILEESEKALLTELQEALEVPENIAVTIIQVMMIKNRG